MDLSDALRLLPIIAIFIALITLVGNAKRKPKLSIFVEPNPPGSQKNDYNRSEANWLHVIVKNESLAESTRVFDRILATFGDRSNATECSAEITFFNEDFSRRFKQPMKGRWSHTVSGNITLSNGQLPKGLPEKVIIPPGTLPDPICLDIAVRNKDKDECYGWNDVGRAHPYCDNFEFINPDWTLAKGRYIVKVQVYPGGQKPQYFRLCNDGDYDSFHLEEIKDKKERAQIEKKCL